jgi:hypothetical protein
MLPTSPIYRGIYAILSVRATDAVDAAPTGPPLAVVPLASVVSVAVQVPSPPSMFQSTLPFRPLLVVC